MTDFQTFKLAMQEHIEWMKQFPLYVTAVTSDDMKAMYLDSFPEGTNPIFRERREYDCNCCLNYIRDMGSVVAIVDNEPVSIWNFTTGTFFDAVCEQMDALVTSHAIKDALLRESRKIGTDRNEELNGCGSSTGIVWEHMYCEIPSTYVMKRDQIPTKLNELRSNKDVFKRSMVELSLEAAETVLDLIKQNSLYRGEEHQEIVTKFVGYKHEWDTIPEQKQDAFAWIKSAALGGASKIRNTVIGTLLSDLSEGVELDVAVKKYDDKVAPQNYKRTSALVTPRMIKAAETKVMELGVLASLARRSAHAEDITINNVLFADRDSKIQNNPFDQLIKQAPTNTKKFGEVAEITMDKFIADVLPTATGVEVLLENKQEANLVSLVAPVNEGATTILKWGNNFSWSYNGEVTDSMKERVKAAGGNVTGDLRFSIQWNDDSTHNRSDYDAHCDSKVEHIYFGKRKGLHSGGVLDVDIVDPKLGVPAVENITWANRNRIPAGDYVLSVNNFSKRQGCNGFTAEVEFDGVIHSFTQPKSFNGKIPVATVKCDGKGNFTLVRHMSGSEGVTPSKEIWGINTNNFHKVETMMMSPNHWDGEKVGNRHFFFMLAGCKNPEPVRGFYSEFLRADLLPHRKVFEHLAGQMKAPVSDEQLSGVGFSSTQKNSLTVRVTGTSTRVIKVTI